MSISVVSVLIKKHDALDDEDDDYAKEVAAAASVAIERGLLGIRGPKKCD